MTIAVVTGRNTVPARKRRTVDYAPADGAGAPPEPPASVSSGSTGASGMPTSLLLSDTFGNDERLLGYGLSVEAAIRA